MLTPILKLHFSFFLTVSERIREAETPSALAAHVPLTASKISTKLGKLSEKEKTQDSDVSLGEPSSKRQKIIDENVDTKREFQAAKPEPTSSHDRKKDKEKQPESEKKRPRTDEGRSSRTGENSERKHEERNKEDRRREKGTSKAKRKRKPFEKILEDVVFVLSGYQNPERATYRSHAIAMGAHYRPDWKDGECTHLV